MSFENDKAQIWEKFIYSNLPINYWNEYLSNNEVKFIFHLPDGFHRYHVKKYINNEVLFLCCQLCNCTFLSIKDMLINNNFYKDILLNY